MLQGVAPLRGLLKNPHFVDSLVGSGPWAQQNPQPLHITVEGPVVGEEETDVGAGAGERTLSLRHKEDPHCWTLGLAGMMAGWSAGSWLKNSANNIIT